MGTTTSDKHGVSVGQEAVPCANSVRIRRQHLLTAGKCCHQSDEG